MQNDGNVVLYSDLGNAQVVMRIPLWASKTEMPPNRGYMLRLTNNGQLQIEVGGQQQRVISDYFDATPDQPSSHSSVKTGPTNAKPLQKACGTGGTEGTTERSALLVRSALEQLQVPVPDFWRERELRVDLCRHSAAVPEDQLDVLQAESLRAQDRGERVPCSVPPTLLLDTSLPDGLVIPALPGCGTMTSLWDCPLVRL
jgi:hypothetical protein